MDEFALDFQLKGTTEKGTTASLLWRVHIIADQAVHQAATWDKKLFTMVLKQIKGFCHGLTKILTAFDVSLYYA